jgi:hypothetical protein
MSGRNETTLPGYLRSKVELHLRLGPARYRKADHFHLPPEDWPEDVLALVKSGYEQLLQGIGLAEDRPLEGIGITGLNSMMAILHFQLTHQAARSPEKLVFLDECLYQHRVTPDMTVTLWNRVVHPAVPPELEEAFSRMT